jgi:hypothetical protein
MRIENRAGGGYPDCTIVLGGLPFWVELKASKNAKLQISPHQIAWHTSLCKGPRSELLSSISRFASH